MGRGVVLVGQELQAGGAQGRAPGLDAGQKRPADAPAAELGADNHVLHQQGRAALGGGYDQLGRGHADHQVRPRSGEGGHEHQAVLRARQQPAKAVALPPCVRRAGREVRLQGEEQSQQFDQGVQVRVPGS